MIRLPSIQILNASGGVQHVDPVREVRPGFHRGTRLQPLPDQQPSALVLVQIESLDGYSLGHLAIGRFDRAEIFADMMMTH